MTLHLTTPLCFPNSLCMQTHAELDALAATAQDQGLKLGVEVIADRSGKFCGNAVKHDTVEVAIEAAEDLAGRWLAVIEYRIVVIAGEAAASHD